MGLTKEELRDGLDGALDLICDLKNKEQPSESVIESSTLLDALDGLWGVCDNLCDICQMMVDSQDGRLINANNALTKAQDAIQKLMDEATQT